MNIDISKFELSRSKDILTEKEKTYLDTLNEEDILSLINQCNNKYNYHNAVQTGLKLILNSVFGSFGNPFFVCSTNDIAGAITSMGRDLIKYMDIINETYWYDYWHEDTELHEHLGIKNVEKLDNSWIHRESKTSHDGEVTQLEMEDGIYQRKQPVSAYVDTDSLFVCFDSIIDKYCEPGKEQEFITKICKFRLEPLFKSKLKGYAKKFKVDNIQDFELENINESVIFLTKKKYIKHTIWEDGTQYPRLNNITPKGVALIQKGTPKFARENVMQIINYLFDNSKTYNIKDLLKYVSDMKKVFKMTDINDIIQTTNINSYWSSKIIVDGQLIDGPGVVQDKDKLEFGKKTYFTIKAAGLYNHLLHNHPELINTYEVIKPGTKVKIYPCLHELNDKFCFIPGKFPKEFAPDIDYDTLFQKTVADQVNYYLDALGLPQLNKRLRVVISLW